MYIFIFYLRPLMSWNDKEGGEHPLYIGLYGSYGVALCSHFPSFFIKYLTLESFLYLYSFLIFLPWQRYIILDSSILSHEQWKLWVMHDLEFSKSFSNVHWYLQHFPSMHVLGDWVDAYCTRPSSSPSSYLFFSIVGAFSQTWYNYTSYFLFTCLVVCLLDTRFIVWRQF